MLRFPYEQRLQIPGKFGSSISEIYIPWLVSVAWTRRHSHATISIPVPATFTYPIFLDVTTRPIVIIGGGAVAVRKAKGMLDAGATNVTCVSPAFHHDLPEGVKRVQAEYDERYLDRALLVFAATNSGDVNIAVVEGARRRGILVNRVDDSDLPGDFTTPATHRDGSITVAVGAGGNPTIAAAVRNALGEKLDPRWAALNDAVSQLRTELRDVTSRVPMLKKLATYEALDVFEQTGLDGLKRWVMETKS